MIRQHIWNTEKDAQNIVIAVCKAAGVRNVLEVGTFIGSTSFALAEAGFNVTTCDISDQRDELVKTHENIKFVLGDISAVTKLYRSFDAAFIDGDHDYAGVSRDFKTCENLRVPLIFLHDSRGHEDVKRFVTEQKNNAWYDMINLNTSDGDGLAILKRS